MAPIRYLYVPLKQCEKLPYQKKHFCQHKEIPSGDEAVANEATATKIPAKTGAKNGVIMSCLSLSIGILESIRFKKLGRC